MKIVVHLALQPGNWTGQLVRFVPTAKSNVVIVSDDTLLTLISHEPNVPSKLFCYLAAVATFTQQGIHSPDLGPALF